MTLPLNLNQFQANGFRVVIDRENYPTMEFMCSEAVHPGVNGGSVPIPFRGQTAHMPGDKLDFEQLSLTVYIDEGFKSYEEIFDWVCRANLNKYKSSADNNFRRSSDITTLADISIPLMNSSNNQFGKFVYKDCLPVSLSGITFNAKNAAVEYPEFTITFDITNFELTLF